MVTHKFWPQVVSSDHDEVLPLLFALTGDTEHLVGVLGLSLSMARRCRLPAHPPDLRPIVLQVVSVQSLLQSLIHRSRAIYRNDHLFAESSKCWLVVRCEVDLKVRNANVGL